jgi:hypothetical protein
MIIVSGKFSKSKIIFRILLLLCYVILLKIMLPGCSSNGNNPVIPDLLPKPGDKSAALRNNTLCIDFRTVYISRDMGHVSVDIHRQASDALNILGFLEPPPMGNLRIDFETLKINADEELVTVDVIIEHPLLTGEKRFNGFDVRGIVFGPDMLNADGFVRWFNPGEFSDLPLGYHDGLLGTEGLWENYPRRFNGYKYFAGGIEPDQDVDDFFLESANVSLRGVFQEGDDVCRRYVLSWKDQVSPVDFFVFNYAVYANYRFPKGQPPYGLDAFSLSANSAEAIFARVTENENTLFFNEDTGSAGGSIDFDIEIFDWQGVESTYTASIKSVEQDLLPETELDFVEIASPNSAIFNIQADVEPLTVAGLEFLITCSDGTTYGDAYIASLMPPSHHLYDEPIVVKFPYTAKVSNLPEGINLIDSGELPSPLPITEEKDFCVVTGDPDVEGVYYFGHVGPIPPDTQPGGIFRYPLDYSSGASLYLNLNSTIGGFNDYDLWGDEIDLASIELASIGAGLFTSGSIDESVMVPYLHRDIAFWFDTMPLLRNGIACPKGHGILKWIDVSANYNSGTDGRIIGLAITDDLMKDTYPPDGTEVGLVTIHNPYYYYDARFNRSMFEKDTEGDVNGKVDDVNSVAVAFDGSPQGLTHEWTNSVVYILEADGTPSIEVFELNVMNEDSTTLTYHITTIDDLGEEPVGPIDIECFPAFSLGFSSDWNWVAVLENPYEDEWSVSLWEQDGTFVARSPSFDGTPLHLDIDGESGLIHVWFEQGESIQWARLEYIDL